MATYNTALTNSAGLSAAIAVSYDKEFLDYLFPELHMQDLGFKKTLPKGAGTGLVLTRSSRFSEKTSAITEGTVPDGSTWQTTSVTLTPLQYANWAPYSDRLAMESFTDTGEELMQLLGENAGSSLDLVTRNLLHSNCTNQFAGGAGNEGAVASVFNIGEIRTAVKTLRTNNAKEFPDGTYHSVIHPAQEADLRADTAVGGWLDVNKYVSEGHKSIMNGEIGRLLNVRFAVSSNVGTGTGSGSEPTYRAFISGNRAFYLVDLANTGVQRFTVKPTATAFDPVAQIGTVGWKAYFVAGNIDTNRIIEVYSTSAY